MQSLLAACIDRIIRQGIKPVNVPMDLVERIDRERYDRVLDELLDDVSPVPEPKPFYPNNLTGYAMCHRSMPDREGFSWVWRYK